MDTIHLINETVLAAVLVLTGVAVLARQARRHRADMRAVLDRQSEALALQADLAAARSRRDQRSDKGTLQGLRLY